VVELEQKDADNIRQGDLRNFRRSRHRPQTVVYTVIAATAFRYKYSFRTRKFLYVFVSQLCVSFTKTFILITIYIKLNLKWSCIT